MLLKKNLFFFFQLFSLRPNNRSNNFGIFGGRISVVLELGSICEGRNGDRLSCNFSIFVWVSLRGFLFYTFWLAFVPGRPLVCGSIERGWNFWIGEGSNEINTMRIVYSRGREGKVVCLNRVLWLYIYIYIWDKMVIKNIKK